MTTAAVAPATAPPPALLCETSELLESKQCPEPVLCYHGPGEDWRAARETCLEEGGGMTEFHDPTLFMAALVLMTQNGGLCSSWHVDYNN